MVGWARLVGWVESVNFRVKGFGEWHPEVADSLNTLGALHFARGDFQQALASYDAAQRIWAETYGPLHPQVPE